MKNLWCERQLQTEVKSTFQHVHLLLNKISLTLQVGPNLKSTPSF